MGDLHLVDVIICGAVVVVVVAILGVMCWSTDQAVTHGHPIAHAGRSRRASQRDRLR